MKKTILSCIALVCTAVSITTFVGCSNQDTVSSQEHIETTSSTEVATSKSTESEASSVYTITNTVEDDIEKTSTIRISKSDLPENFTEDNILSIICENYGLLNHPDISLKCVKNGSDKVYTWYDFTEYYKDVPVYFGNIRVLISNNADTVDLIGVIYNDDSNNTKCVYTKFNDITETYTAEDGLSKLDDDSYTFVEDCYHCVDGTGYYCHKYTNLRDFVYLDATDAANKWKSPAVFTVDEPTE